MVNYVNKKGDLGKPLKLFLWVAVIYLVIAFIGLFVYNEFGIPDEVVEGAGQRITEAASDTQSNGDIIAPELRFLDFVIGQTPTFLIEWTGETSAFIIILGIWILLFLTFSDIISIFGTFNQATSWIIGGVLAIIAANIKFVSFLGVIGLVLASGLGTIAVFVEIIGIFVLFVAFNYGTDSIREWVWKRKVANLKLRAAMGSERAKEGLKTLAEIGQQTYELGS